MTKQAAKTEKKKPDVITKNESEHILVKFKPEELKEKQNALSEMLMQKFELENLIIQSKTQIKEIEKGTKELKELITCGGEWRYEDCEVKIYPKTMVKEIYYNGELVKTEKAQDWELQLEIDEEEETED